MLTPQHKKQPEIEWKEIEEEVIEQEKNTA